MKLVFLFLSCLASLLHVHCSVQLVESGPGTVKPGGSLRLTCTVTGDSIKSVFWEWVRQAPGKGLEWLGQIDWDGSNWRTYYASSLQGRITLSADASSNTYSLHLNSLTSADTATYYCSRSIAGPSYYGAFDYWGRGTSVTVTPGTQSVPSLFPLIAYGGTPNSAGDITIGCLAKDFLPGTITFSWNNPDNSSLAANKFGQSPVFPQPSGTFLATSQADVPASKWKNHEPFYCTAAHSAGNRKAKVVLSCPTSCPPSSPKPCPSVPTVIVETIPPSFADIYETKSAKLTCRISHIPSGQNLQNLNVSWTRASDQKTLETTLGESKYLGNMQLGFVDAVATVYAKEWNSEETFTCRVDFPDLLPSSEERHLKKPQGTQYAPSVFVLSPHWEELALREKATITALIKGFWPNDIFVKWLRNGEPIADSEYISSEPVQQSKTPEMYFSYSMLSISEEEWNSGNTFTCVVGHEALPLQTTQKTVDKNTGKPSVVNVSLVLSDTSSTCY